MKTLKRKTLAALLALSLLASLLPVGAQPVLAAAPNGQVIYVGNENVTSGGYWTTDSNGSVTAYTEDGTTPSNNYIHYNKETNTLTLHNATIREYVPSDTSNYVMGAGIGVFNQSGDAELTIRLEGTNTIAEVGKGIDVLANSTGGATLTITGNGSLDASGSQTGIWVQSNSGDATLTIQNADVTAENSSSSGDGVLVQAGQSSNASLSVNGGSLTATGSGTYGAGIRFLFGSSDSSSRTPSLTVSNNAIVRANSGISDNSSADIKIGADSSGNTGGIVFDGGEGTVYGDVTLQDDLAIGEGESLTIGKDASLTVPDGKNLTNNGTVTTTDGGSLTNQGTINNSGTLPDNIQGSAPPKITTTSLLPGGTVGTAYSQSLAADNNPTSWSVTEGDLPDGLSLNSDGTITGTPTTAKTYNFTVTATNASGSDSKQFSLMVTQPVTGVTLNPASLSLFTGDNATLTATVEPGNATNKNVTWSSNNEAVATVDNNGKVTAKSAGTAIITVTTEDGSKTATCKVTVTDKTYTISADTTALNFGSAYTGYAQPAAQTVTVKNTGNQTVTLNQPASTSSFEVGTLSKTELAAGETATFTVQPKTGLSVGTYSDTITVSGSENVIVTIPASFTVKSRPSYNPPTVSEETTDAIADAQPGETVTVDLSSGSTKLDKEVFETLAGKDVTLVIDLGDDVSWTVKGSDIPEDADFTDIDMGVTMNSDGIPVDVVNAITGERDSVQMTLAHDGDFGFTMMLTAPLGVENSGYWANLYHYDEADEQLTFETAAEIDADGSVSLPMSHASQYAIVIDDHSHATIDLPFSDVSADDWFYDPVVWIYNEGLMTGTSATMFEPNTSTTRAMIVAMLARLENITSADSAGFTDVAADDWYATAVNWAAASGITSGTADGNFSPNTAITREQLAAILMNYAQYKGQDVSARATLDTYNDATAISSWANDVMSWAVAEGLLTGVTNDQLQPQGNATRAQVAAILQRFLCK